MTFDALLTTGQPIIMVEITAAKGSTPREAGAFMLVLNDGIYGTIGGGNLEHEAIAHARVSLSGRAVQSALEITLGPDTGQCCGGVVSLGFTLLDQPARHALAKRVAAEQTARPEVVLYGAGHVGRALAQALMPLPFNVSVVETRLEELKLLPPDIPARLTPIPEETVRLIAPGGAVVILTHDHALDFLIATEALRRNDLRYIGMIGSATKRGVFAGWLKRQGQPAELIDRLVLPIGQSLLDDKRPPVIAALVAAELAECLLKT